MIKARPARLTCRDGLPPGHLCHIHHCSRKPPLPAPLASWLREHSEQLFIPAIAVAEIEEGICTLRRAGETRRASLLSAWLDALIQDYGDRVLALDAACGRIAGAVSDAATAAGRNPGFPNVAIAAIASVHELIVLTRNLRHFAGLGVEHIDPFGLRSAQG